MLENPIQKAPQLAVTSDMDDADDVEICRAYISRANRGIVTKHRDLKVFNESDHKAELSGMSKGMTIQEICDFYGISFETLPANDKFFFCAMFLKGRVTGVTIATQKLFNSMAGKDGTKASLTYLVRFGANWTGAIEDAKGVDGKSLQIQIVDS